MLVQGFVLIKEKRNLQIDCTWEAVYNSRKSDCEGLWCTVSGCEWSKLVAKGPNNSSCEWYTRYVPKAMPLLNLMFFIRLLRRESNRDREENDCRFAEVYVEATGTSVVQSYIEVERFSEDILQCRRFPYTFYTIRVFVSENKTRSK